MLGTVFLKFIVRVNVGQVIEIIIMIKTQIHSKINALHVGATRQSRRTKGGPPRAQGQMKQQIGEKCPTKLLAVLNHNDHEFIIIKF